MRVTLRRQHCCYLRIHRAGLGGGGCWALRDHEDEDKGQTSHRQLLS